VEDRTETGRKLRILTVEDEFTRECVGLEVERRMNAKFVAATLLKLFAERGVPQFIRSDNGPEFIARSLARMFAVHGVAARHIDPGSPWRNGRNERFNGSLRDECLNLETFHNRDHARALVKLYGRSYNERRPHSSLGYPTPKEHAEKWKAAEGAGTFSVPAK
jgi:putative transposase